MIFGGTNLNCYCKSKIFTFTLVNKKKIVEKPHKKERNVGEKSTEHANDKISAPNSFVQSPHM